MKPYIIFIIISFSHFIVLTVQASCNTYCDFGINLSFEKIKPDGKNCAVYSTFLLLNRLKINVGSITIQQEFLQFSEPPYSLLDVIAILERRHLKCTCLRFKNIENIFSTDFSDAIFVFNFINSDVCHFSYCFKGKDGKLWIADPALNDKCIEFTPKSKLFKSFTGIILKVERIEKFEKTK